MLAGLSLLWTAGLFAAPFAHASGWDAGAMLGRLAYSPGCHQDPVRSLLLDRYGSSLSCLRKLRSLHLTEALRPVRFR